LVLGALVVVVVMDQMELVLFSVLSLHQVEVAVALHNHKEDRETQVVLVAVAATIILEVLRPLAELVTLEVIHQQKVKMAGQLKVAVVVQVQLDQMVQLTVSVALVHIVVLLDHQWLEEAVAAVLLNLLLTLFLEVSEVAVMGRSVIAQPLEMAPLILVVVAVAVQTAPVAPVVVAL